MACLGMHTIGDVSNVLCFVQLAAATGIHMVLAVRETISSSQACITMFWHSAVNKPAWE